MKWHGFLLLFSLSATGLAAQNAASDYESPDSAGSVFRKPGSVNLWTRTHIRYGLGVDSVYKLPDQYILQGSEVITVNGTRLQRNMDYRILYRFGEITFTTVIDTGVMIQFCYEILPFGFKTEYFRRRLDSVIVHRDLAQDTMVIKSVISESGRYSNLFENSQIQGTGTITRGFTVGSNQDFTLNSGLNIQIAGNITEDVTIEASLTDESTPIQPEGNTESLQEIDKVFVEIRKADKYAVTFGDFNVDLTGTEFAGYSRKLQGVKTMVNTRRMQADFAYATSKGKFATNTLVIQEGVQGPYELTGSGGERNIIIIAGTEKVWLNGVAMVRGEDQDYVIDYSAAQITFTRRRLIAAESRVVVDFEYSEDLYPRNSFSGNLRTAFADDRLIVGGRMVYEYDDKNNPINITLSRRTIDSLSKIRDDSLTAGGKPIFVDGAVYVGYGKGNYIKRYHPESGDSIFVYVGSDSAGNYNVRFTNFGFGNGDYIRGNILGEFRYAGHGMGDFQPLVPLTLPNSSLLGDFYIESRPFRRLQFRGEVAMSAYDINTYSPDGMNGAAYVFTAGLQDQPLKIAGWGMGTISFDGKYRHKDSTFREVSRVNDAEFNRYWNTGGGRAPNPFLQEDLYDFRGRYYPVKEIEMSMAYGALDRGINQFNSERWDYGLGFIKEKYPQIRLRREEISSRDALSGTVFKSTVGRNTINAVYRIWKIQPGFDYEDEKINNSYTAYTDSLFGSAYYIYRPRLDVTGFSKSQFGYSLEKRLDYLKNRKIDTLSGLYTVSTTHRAYWNLNDWKNLTSRIEYQQRERTYRGNFRTVGNLDKTTRLASAAADYTPFRKAVTLSVNYQVSEERIQDRKIIFIEVGPNQGNYVKVDADSFRQVPQGQGNWVQGSVRSGNFTPIVEIKFGGRLRFEPGKLYAASESASAGESRTAEEAFTEWVLKNTVTETMIRVEENQKNPEWSFYFMDLKKYQNRLNTVRGSLLFRQDLYFYQSYSDRSVRLRYERQKNLTNMIVDGFERRSRYLYNIRGRKQLGVRWSAETEAETEYHRKQSTVAISGIQPSFLIRHYKILTQFSYRATTSLELIPRASCRWSQESVMAVRSTMLTVNPEAVYSIQNKGRASLLVEYTRINLNNKKSMPPYELTDGNLLGTTYRWYFNMDYRLGQHVTLALNYSGRKEPKQELIHLGGAEFRAFF